jgi:uncharacterized protein YaaR (DUF327 family)
MVQFKTEYLDFIIKNGVGSKDWVSSSPKSYISYLSAISNLLCKDITPEILSKEEDVAMIATALKGRRNPATIRNYKSAMRQYVQMVNKEMQSDLLNVL